MMPTDQRSRDFPTRTSPIRGKTHADVGHARAAGRTLAVAAAAAAGITVAGCTNLNVLSTGGAPQATAATDPEKAESRKAEPRKALPDNAGPPAAEAADAHLPPAGDKLTALANSAFASAKLTGTPAISAVRPTHDNQWGDYVFCITGTAPAAKYAVLVGHGAVLEVRTSIYIDGCEQETYQPVAPPPRKAVPRR